MDGDGISATIDPRMKMDDGKLKNDSSAYQVQGEGTKGIKTLKKSGKQRNDSYKTSSVQRHDTNQKSGCGGVGEEFSLVCNCRSQRFKLPRIFCQGIKFSLRERKFTHQILFLGH